MCLWFPTVEAVPVIGFEEPSYSVLEGFSVSACVNITGFAVEPLALQMVTVLAGNAEGICILLAMTLSHSTQLHSDNIIMYL